MINGLYTAVIAMGLTRILYNLILTLGLVLGAPIWGAFMLAIPKLRAGFAEKWGRYPDELRQKLSGADPDKKRIWFHAVSVGEFNAIRSLINDLREEYTVIVTTTTGTGQALARRTYPDLAVMYFPYDWRPVLHQALDRVKPDLVVLTESELWPNFIDVVTGQQIPLVVINGRISRSSHRGYRWIRAFMRPYLRRITHFYMQSQGDADRINDIGKLPPEQITVAGNIKFDLVPTLDPIKKNILAHLLDIEPGEDTVITLASTHSGEDELLLDTAWQLRKDFPELKIILAPRHPERVNEIRTLLNGKGIHFALRSQLSEENPNRQPVVVLDTIGELLTVYSFSTVAVMGGSFIERGGQNPLEPLSQRVPVLFGPHMFNFPEISRMIVEQHAGYQVSSQEELVNAVTELLTQPEIYDSVAEHGQQLVENNRGAKEIIIQGIRAHLGDPTKSAVSAPQAAPL